jgi:hypothetical protein
MTGEHTRYGAVCVWHVFTLDTYVPFVRMDVIAYTCARAQVHNAFMSVRECVYGPIYVDYGLSASNLFEI